MGRRIAGFHSWMSSGFPLSMDVLGFLHGCPRVSPSGFPPWMPSGFPPMDVLGFPSHGCPRVSLMGVLFFYQLGSAIDFVIDDEGTNKTTEQLFCLLETAADSIAGHFGLPENNSSPRDNGCNLDVTHIHVQEN